MKMTKKFFAIVITMVMVFTSIPMVSFGVSTPGKVIIGSAELIPEKLELTITFEKKNIKKCDGYALFSVVAEAGKNKENKVKTITYKKLKKDGKIIYTVDEKDDLYLASASTSAKTKECFFKVKSYNKYKVKQYYNSKTKKWVSKKPKKSQWKGKKTRKKTAYKYCKASNKDTLNVTLPSNESSGKNNDENISGGGAPSGGGGGGAPSGGGGGGAPSGGGGGGAPSGGGGGGTPSGGGGGSTPVDVGPGKEIIPTPPPAATCTGIAKATDLTYTGSPISLLSNGGSATGGEIKYCVVTNSGDTAPADDKFGSTYTKTDAGTYYVWYYVKGDANHSDSAKQKIGSIEIKKAAPIVTAPTLASDKDYTGSPISLLSNGGQATGGELKYYVTKDSGTTKPADSKFGSTYTKTNGGTYYVWYYVKGDKNHKDSEKKRLGPIKIKQETKRSETEGPAL